MLAIVSAEGPASRPVPVGIQNETNVAVAYGQCLNHQALFAQLAALATPIVEQRPIESTFTAPHTP